MSGYRKHYLVAAGCGATLTLVLHNSGHVTHLFTLSNASFILASILGGLFPDIDIKSKGQQLLYAMLIPFLAAALLAQQILLSILLGALGVLSPLLPHRGITHELWFVIAAPLIGPALIAMYCPEYTDFAAMCYVFFVVGAVSHLVLDFGPLILLQRTIAGFYRIKQRKIKRK